MFKCTRCGRDNFKSKSGLKRHIEGCNIEENETKDDLGSQREKHPPPVGDDTLEVRNNPPSENGDVSRKIRKLRDQRASMFDAQTRHNIDLEIKKLEESS